MRSFLHLVAGRAIAGLGPFLSPSVVAQTCGPSYIETFDRIRAPLLPSGWIGSQGINLTGAPPWRTSTVTPYTPANDVLSPAPDNILDNRLDVQVYLSPFDPVFTFY